MTQYPIFLAEYPRVIGVCLSQADTFVLGHLSRSLASIPFWLEVETAWFLLVLAR